MMLFLCETKSQILNAVALKMLLFKDEQADICLSRKVAMPIAYEEKLKEIGIFANVFSFKSDYIPQQNFRTMFKKALSYIKLVREVQKILEGKLRNDYNRVFVSGPGVVCPAVYYAIKNNNPGVILSLYEEGTFEYIIFNYPWNNKRRWYSNLVYGSFYLDDAKELYLYDPDLAIDVPNRVAVKAIPKIYSNKEFCNYVNHIFEYRDDGLDDFGRCDFLFLETFFNDDKLEKVQSDLLGLLYKKLGKKLRVKLHPRSDIHKYDEIGVKSINTTQSMEMILLNKSVDVSQMVFISPLSSAIVNIKLMFGWEPTMILLDNLMEFPQSNGWINMLAFKFVERYAKQRLYHPSDVDSLEAIIDKLLVG